jgi:hypothetical protein
MDRRDERLLRNEVVFRRVNERLQDVAEAFSVVSERAEFVCECSDPACIEQIEMGLDEYERIRARSARFFMVPGHEQTEIESVVRRTDRYVVVQKPPGEVADAAADPPGD